MSAERTDSGHIGRRVLLNTGALAGSRLWRILISFGLQLLIANRLGAAGLGQYNTVLAYLNVCQVLSELGLPQLLARDLSQRPQDRLSSFYAALLLQGGAAFLVWGGLSLLTFILPLGDTNRLALIVVGATLPFFAVTSVCEMLFQAGERMQLVMGVEAPINTLIVVLSGIVLWSGGNVVSLAAVLVLIQAISGMLCLFLLRRSGLLLGATPAHKPDALWAQMSLLVRRARPFYTLALSNVLLQRLDILLVSALAGEVITGIYSAAYLIVRMLLTLIQTYWQALYPTLSRLRKQSARQYTSLARVALRFGLLALLPVAALSSVIAGVAGALVQLIFRGDDYLLSARILPVLIWAAPFYLIALFCVNILLVEGKPRQSLLVPGAHIAVVLILLPSLTVAVGVDGFAPAVIVAVFTSALYGLLLLRRLEIPLGLPRQTGRLLGVTGLAALTAYLAQRGLDGSYAWLGALLAGGATYIAGVYAAGLVTIADFQRIWKVFT